MKQELFALMPRRLYLEGRWWHYRLSNNRAFAKLQERRSTVTEEGYSLQPFDETKSIFVHIPKCAGVSVSKTLYGNLAGGHTTFEKYLNTFNPKEITQFFKFTIVRNPWDRLVSAYHFLRNGGFGEKNRAWFQQNLSEYRDFDEFVIKWLDRKNIWEFHHFRPQYHYMLERRGLIHLDFIAFLENLDDDFNYISDRLRLGCSLPHANRSSHAQYQSYYNSATRKKVAEVYSEDITMLGYSFDNSSLNDQLRERRKGKIYGL